MKRKTLLSNQICSPKRKEKERKENKGIAG
jgi:hypothetical protein